MKCQERQSDREPRATVPPVSDNQQNCAQDGTEEYEGGQCPTESAKGVLVRVQPQDRRIEIGPNVPREGGWHLVEMRRSIPIGNKRYYFVFLFGQERRALRRLYSQGMATMGFNLFGYLLTAVGCILPLALVIALLT